MLNWLDGKKTIIAAAAWPIFQLVTAQGWLTGTAATVILLILTTLTGAGLSHKALKAKGSG